MFHCNGWCTAWAVTAVGGTHVCLRAVGPTRSGADRRRRRHPSQRRPGRDDRDRARARGASADAAGHRHDGAAPRRARPRRRDGGARRACHPRLRPDRGLRALLGVRDGSRLACARPPARAQALAAKASGMVTRADVRVVDQDMADVPADGATIGEIVMRGNDVMTRLLPRPGGDRGPSPAAGFTPATSASASRRLRRARGPRQGHRHLRRREHLDGRGRAGARSATRR